MRYRRFLKCFRPLDQVIRAQAAMILVATTRQEPGPESESDPIPQNPCECAEERKTRRERARACLSEASLHETPAGLSTARRLLGSDTDFAAMQSIAPAGRAIGSANSGSDPKNLKQTPGSPFLLLTLLLAKQKKSESPAAATERHRNSATLQSQFKSKVSDRKPTKPDRDRAFSGSEPKFPVPSARPTGVAQRNWDLTPKTRKPPAPPVTERIKK